MSKQRLIGIPGWKMGENSYGCGVSYMNYLSHFGQVRVLAPDEPIDERIDLICVPGGADVDPLRYNAIPGYYTGRPDIHKEYFDTRILPQYIALGKAVFAICRGIQSVAVLYGAKLIQDMWHETNLEEDRGGYTHSIELTDTDFKVEFRKETGIAAAIKVNSMHHQCVSSFGFPDDLEILAYYKGKYTASIEAIRHRKLPIYCVQYHPEEMAKDPLGDFIMEKLLNR